MKNRYGLIEKRSEKMVLFRSSNGSVNLKVRLEGESVWLTQKQIALLFETDRSVVTKHLGNVFKTKELHSKSVCAKFAHTADDGKTYQVDYYNFDAIISVGYRVNSKRGTQFRIWATSVLRKHIINGYTINEKRLKERNQRLIELERTVELMTNLVETRVLAGDEADGLLHVIMDYARGLRLLELYDHQKLEIEETTVPASFIMTYEKAQSAVNRMAERMRQESRNPELFGIERGGEFKGAIGSIYQTVNGRDAYPSVEEKAAHLLYFVVKDHGFVDGNKRIGAALFLWFLHENGLLYVSGGGRRLANNALVALTLLIAESKPSDKDTLIKIIVNLINRKNSS